MLAVEQMKIIIFAPNSTKIDMNSLDNRPLGGADQVLIRLIKYLSKDHAVISYINTSKNSMSDDYLINPYQDLFDKKIDCDIFINYRKAWVIPRGVIYKKAIFYSQDDADSPCFNGIRSEFFDQYDRIIALSGYHRDRIKEIFGFDRKITIIGNAAEKQDHKACKKEDDTFIYASTPFRGLPVLAKIWKDRIIKDRPEAILHIYSSMAIYDGQVLDQLHFQRLYDKLKTISGIIYHGSVKHSEVIDQMRKSKMLLYPNTYPETFCNVMMEARSCFTPFVTSRKGALPETGKNAGLYIRGNPYDQEYQREFAYAIKTILDDPEIYRLVQRRCYPIRTWKEWEQDITELIENV